MLGGKIEFDGSMLRDKPFKHSITEMLQPYNQGLFETSRSERTGPIVRGIGNDVMLVAKPQIDSCRMHFTNIGKVFKSRNMSTLRSVVSSYWAPKSGRRQSMSR